MELTKYFTAVLLVVAMAGVAVRDLLKTYVYLAAGVNLVM
jgi:hypothetical protein